MRYHLAMLGAGLLAATALSAQAKDDWDVTQPRGKTREIDFTVSEGTWTQVDVSPDGQWIVFDLLSQVYRMPAAGGQAEPAPRDRCIERGIVVAHHAEILRQKRRHGVRKTHAETAPSPAARSRAGKPGPLESRYRPQKRPNSAVTSGAGTVRSEP